MEGLMVMSPRSRSQGIKSRMRTVAGPAGVPNNFWYCRIEKAGDVVLGSDRHFYNACLVQADPEVVSFCVRGDARRLQSATNGADIQDFDVAATLGDGGLRLYDVVHPMGPSRDLQDPIRLEARAQLAGALGGTHVVIGADDIDARAIAVANWQYANAAINACAHHPLSQSKQTLQDLFERNKVWTIDQVLSVTPLERHPELLAALFVELSQGGLRSDLDRRPFGKRTLLWIGDAQMLVQGAEGYPDLEQLAPVSPKPETLEQKQLRVLAARTATVVQEIEKAVSLAENAANPLWITRKTIPPEVRDYRKWPTVAEDTLDEPERTRFRALRAALIAYIDGAKVLSIEKENGVCRAELIRQLNRALSLHDDGRLVGWRALNKDFRTVPYQRNAPISAGDESLAVGYAGALGLLFRSYPKIQNAINEEILQTPVRGKVYESSVTASSVHSVFLKQCAAAGITAFDWPFNEKTQARYAIRRYVADMKSLHFTRTAQINGGRGAGHRAKLGNGIQPSIRFDQLPYQTVAQDGHTLDLIGRVRVPHPSGFTVISISRIRIQVVVEFAFKACLGYSVSIGSDGTADDALAANQHALSVWAPRTCEHPLIAYPKGAGLPSGVIPELAGVGWSIHMLDSASINTSVAMLERLRTRVGCAVNVGPVGDWTRRRLIEAVFSVLEKRGFQRLPNTTGSHPKDPRRKDPEAKAISIECDWTEILYLIDVALATYNVTPIESLGWRSPLQGLKDCIHDSRSDFVPRRLPLPLPGQPDLHVVTESRPVRGNIKEGRRPYIEVDRVHYTSALLANAAWLIGQRLSVHIDVRDMRTVLVFLPDGSELGFLVAGRGWDRIPHDRVTRKQINRLMDLRQLERRPDEDWVQAYLRSKTEKAVAENKGTHKKVSKAATAVAKISHATGLPIPEVPPPHETQLVEISSAQRARPARLPAFVRSRPPKGLY
jgi:putative transposase